MWHVARGSEKRGPFSHDHLLNAARSGGLRPTDMVWKVGMASWIPAADVEGLFSPPTSHTNPEVVSDHPPPLPEAHVAGNAPKKSKHSVGRIALFSFLLILLTSLFYATVGNESSIAAKIISILFVLIAIAIFAFGHKIRLHTSYTVKFYIFLIAFWGLISGLSVQSETDKSLAVERMKASDPDAYLAMILEKSGDQEYLSELEKIDPARFEAEMTARRLSAEKDALAKTQSDLAAMKSQQPQKWMAALKEAFPDQYEEVLRTRGELTDKLLAEVKSVPSSELARNKALYAQLVALNPTNEAYLEKFSSYSEKLVAENWKAENCTFDRSREIGLYVQPIVKSGLKAPRTAKFPWDLSGAYLGECRYRYSSWVDAQNGFGALIRTHYSATLILTPSGWTLESLDYE